MKKLTPLTSLLLLACLHVFSQKLKDVQETGAWAPASIKVNGALTEWNDTFQAYNKSTKIYYTLANDDKNLYLAIKSTDAINNNKINAGGITLALNTAGKKKDKDAYSLTFPFIPPPTRGMRGPGGPAGAGGGRGVAIMDVAMGGPQGRRGVDSAFIKAQRERTIAAAKEIQVLGFKDITDSLISVYNEYGIKAAIGYDAQGNFTYEISVPLKALNLTDAKEIAYNIKINGLKLPNMPGMDDGGGNRGGGGFGGGAPGGGGGFGGGGAPGGGGFGGGPGGGGAGGFQEMISPSDFWGKYTLAKNN